MIHLQITFIHIYMKESTTFSELAVIYQGDQIEDKYNLIYNR